MRTSDDIHAEVQELAWAMIDQQATEEQVRRLEEILSADSEARQVYMVCMQMHADLRCLLGGDLPMPQGMKEALQEKQAQTKKAPAPLPTVDMPSLFSSASVNGVM